MKEKNIEAKTVTVTASTFSSGDQKGVTLTPLEVVSTPGAAADVFWAIKTFPGVQQVEEGAGLFVRGGDVSETIVVLDGAYLSHPYRYESPNGGFFGTISPFLLKETYFSSGGYSAEYGNALSGALIMESMGLPAQRKVTVGLGLAASSGMIQMPLISETLGFSTSGNYSDTKPMFQLNGHRRKFSDYPQAYDLNMNWVYRYSPKGSLKLFVFREEDNVGIEIRDPEDSQIYQGDGINNLANLRWRHVFSKKWYVSSNIAFSNFEQNQQLGVLDLNTDEQLYQFRLNNEYQLTEKISLQHGFSVFRDNVLIDGRVPEDELDLDPSASSLPIDTDYRSDLVTVYNQVQWNFIRNIDLTSGFRFERDSKSQQQFVDPRFSATWRFRKDWNFVFSIGRYHQSPRPDYYDPSVGNPNLKAMQSWHYIAGIVHQTEQSIYRAEVYHKDYQNLLLEDDRLNYTNEGHGHASGLDLFIKREWQHWKGWISYSYLKARRHWMDAPNIAPPEFDITQNLTAVAELNLSMHWHIGTSYRFATGKPYTSAAHLYHDKRVADYHKVDLNLTYLRRFFPGNLTVFYVAVSNLLGRENVFDYIYSPDYQEREPVKATMLRSVYFGVSVTL
ncbi:MAG: TonB-dependent receptor [Aliifodinibius sp.]|nr:TonB-dependent receptor [Fodinibius sp.]